MRATEHAPRDALSVLERRHGLAEIVYRAAVVEVERDRGTTPPPRRHLTPPRTSRAASPPRTRYDFQSPQPSDARFAAQFRAAATASANGKKGELRRMRDEYAALKRDLAEKKSRR